ncbi:MAG: DNA mismatch repair endonuclease MutL, partial [Pseudomonadota bacterium]
MPVRQLPPETVNRIAAGEVVERPASVVKELVENAIDAGARAIEVVTVDGGLALIRVTDDGCGMSEADLALSVARHATSKLAHEDLLDIRTLGFRGEALPSIGAIGKLTIETRTRDAATGLALTVDCGRRGDIRPAALNPGTRIAVRALFSATPARLKFMKSERAENMATAEVVRRLAMAHPEVAFTLTSGERAGLKLPHEAAGADGHLQRLGRIMGRDFLDDALPVYGCHAGIAVRGFAGLPTLNRGDAGQQYLFVNGRPVRDKLLIGAIRAAYGDLVPKGRHPYLALFVDVPPETVDVNVHPAKTEVRFRAPGEVRKMISTGLRTALEAAGHRATSTGGTATLGVLAAAASRPHPAPSSAGMGSSEAPPAGLGFGEAAQAAFDGAVPLPSASAFASDPMEPEHPPAA